MRYFPRYVKYVSVLSTYLRIRVALPDFLDDFKFCMAAFFTW